MTYRHLSDPRQWGQIRHSEGLGAGRRGGAGALGGPRPAADRAARSRLPRHGGGPARRPDRARLSQGRLRVVMESAVRHRGRSVRGRGPGGRPADLLPGGRRGGAAAAGLGGELRLVEAPCASPGTSSGPALLVRPVSIWGHVPYEAAAAVGARVPAPRPCCPPLTERPLTADEAERTARMFKALGDPGAPAALLPGRLARERRGVRLRHLRRGRLPADRLPPPEEAQEAGLLAFERRGTWVYYRVEPSVLAAMGRLLTPAAAGS